MRPSHLNRRMRELVLRERERVPRETRAHERLPRSELIFDDVFLIKLHCFNIHCVNVFCTNCSLGCDGVLPRGISQQNAPNTTSDLFDESYLFKIGSFENPQKVDLTLGNLTLAWVFLNTKLSYRWI